MIWDKFFDHIYIINLDTRSDRWHHMQQLCQQFKMTNFSRFSAIKPKLEHISRNWVTQYQYVVNGQKQKKIPINIHTEN